VAARSGQPTSHDPLLTQMLNHPLPEVRLGGHNFPANKRSDVENSDIDTVMASTYKPIHFLQTGCSCQSSKVENIMAVEWLNHQNSNIEDTVLYLLPICKGWRPLVPGLPSVQMPQNPLLRRFEYHAKKCDDGGRCRRPVVVYFPSSGREAAAHKCRARVP